jgi:hypothetical protein
MRPTTIPTLIIAPIDYSSAMTMVFIDELCEMNLKGLRIRSSLNILMIGMFTFVKLTSINEVTTIKKSS